MLDANQMMLDSWKAYPSQQWDFAIKKFPPASNRMPYSFWRQQRESAIAFLVKYGVDAREECGKVIIGQTVVDAKYID